MRIEKLGEQRFSIFVNSAYLSNVNPDRDKIIELVKSLLVRLRYRLLLHGFYKVKVYFHSRVGIFLELIQLERSDYHSTLDFRTLVYLDEKIYFRTRDYFLLPDADIYYANGYYYCNVDDIPNIENIIEFGDFIYGKDLYTIMFQWRKC